MPQAYSNPKRESDPYSLPDVEVWQDEIVEGDCERCGAHDVHSQSVIDEPRCPSCERTVSREQIRPTGKEAWWFWYCFPGCMPDSLPNGPYSTEAEALQAVRDDAWDAADDDEDED